LSAVDIIIICNTRRVGIKTIFHSTSSQPDFSETNAKLMDRKRQRNTVFKIILLFEVLILEKLNLYFGFISTINICSELN